VSIDATCGMLAGHTTRWLIILSLAESGSDAKAGIYPDVYGGGRDGSFLTLVDQAALAQVSANRWEMPRNCDSTLVNAATISGSKWAPAPSRIIERA
jgi:hypothetical protein